MNVNLVHSKFDTLKKTAQEHINNQFNETSEIRQKIISKNVFNSFFPSERIYHNVGEAFKIEHVKHLEFGSSALHLREMRAAVKEILKDSLITPKEKNVLEKWLVATTPTQKITWIYDYFRMRMPFVLSNIMKGKNPADSFKTRLMARFYRPNNDHLELLSTFINNQLKELKPGHCFAIPSGNLFHETLILVEKDQDGHLKFMFTDPEERTFKEIPMEGMINPLFWKEVCSSKFNHGMSTKNINPQQDFPESFLLQKQFGNQCFAHCHWGFFRIFMLKYMGDSDLEKRFSTSLALEIKIKEKIVKQSDCHDSNLMDLTSKCLLKKN